jgi:hypothetical protein
MRKSFREYGPTARVLGRLYCRNIEYFCILKRIAKSLNRPIPQELRKIIKEQAKELVLIEEQHHLGSG